MRHPITGRFLSTFTPEERFWQKVEKTATCWLFTGACSGNGYGVFWHKDLPSGNVSAHRFSYQLHHGAIPAGCMICHTCDVPNCVNPDHLVAGSPSDNVQDMIHKGRQVIGRRKTKLSEADVQGIRANTTDTTAELGRRFGVSSSLISMLRNHKRRRSVG